MKKQLCTFLKGCIGLLIFANISGCEKDNRSSADTGSSIATVARAAVSQSGFNLWSNCLQPYNISGSNGICVPLGSCNAQNNAAQQKTGQTATGLQFNGSFKGGTNANSGASEEAVFLCDNVSTWQGNEMGFVKTLDNNDLKAYIQHGIGNGQVEYKYQVLLSNDNGYHTFKCQARSANHNMVDFYIDGNYKCTLSSTQGGNYYGNYFYFVGTNHWYGGSDPTGQQIEMYNMTTY
ncbi:MAG: hypothetical protein EOP43_01280 [Sphingobacteriaceae bacterium]|nr:MAG: hypothetical protein EOP43_01280 [Sphingobacteriaceae bacterium]